MVIITGLWFFIFGNVCCCCCKHGRSLIEKERGGMLQQNGNKGLNHKTTHCGAELALHLAQPRLRCHTPFPTKGGPWQGNNYKYNKKRQNKFAVSFVRDIEKVYLLLLLSVSLSVCLSVRFAFSHSFNYCLSLFCLLLFLLLLLPLLPLICAKFWQLKEQASKQVGKIVERERRSGRE